MRRVVFIISILLVRVIVAHGQQPAGNIIDDGDKTGIIKSVLDLEKRNQSSIEDFSNIRDVSSDNIGFIEPSRLSAPGFRILSVLSLNAARQERVVEYLLFSEISLVDGVAIVVLSRVTEGRPCFGPPFSYERRYTYKARRSPVGWIAELITKPTPPISYTRRRSAL